MRDSTTRLAVLLALVLLGGLARAAKHGPSSGGSTPPNVIVIVGDDLGWNDMSWNGAPTIMPNLERLALEGVRLERFYTAPVCSPTRMALLTGRYPIRWGMQRGVVKPDSERGMPRSEEILPEMLADNGYAASHVTGKWHLGQRFSKYHPLRAGFGGFLGNYTGAIDYYSKIRGTYDWHRDFDDDTNYTDYHTDLVGDEAASFIAAHENEPFVLYVPSWPDTTRSKRQPRSWRPIRPA